MREGWKYKKLGEVCLITMGQSPDGASINTVDGMEFHQGKTYFGERFLKKSNQFTISPTKIAEVNSVLLCVRAPVGFPNITNKNICIGRGLCSLSSTSELDNIFLFYALLRKQRYFENNATGSTFKAIPSKVVYNTIIPLPPLSIQQSIVAELDEINNLLTLKRKELERFDKLAQSLFYEMFGDPLENEKGWEVKSITDVCIEISAGGDASKYEIKKIKDETFSIPVYSNGIDCDGLYGYSNHATISLSSITLSARGTIGAAFIRTEPYIPIIRLVSVIPDLSKIDLVYLYFVLKQTKWDNTGGTIPQLPVPKVKQLKLALPPLEFQKSFAQRIEAIEQQKANVKAAIEKLETLLTSRMQYWFE